MANEKHLEILHKGVSAWNQWRKDNPDIKPDLSGANLNNTNLNGANLDSANLITAELYGVNLSHAKLNSANLRLANLNNANLENADLKGAYLRSAHFSAANLRNVNLSNANLIGANLENANLSIANLSDAKLKGVNLGGVNLSSANLSGVDLDSVNLSEVDFSSANLSKTNIEGHSLESAIIRGANLSGIDFTDTNFSDKNLTYTNLTDAGLIRMQALGTNFQGAILTGACIEDWNINSQTSLRDVKCDYIYLKVSYSIEEKKWIKSDRRPHDPNKIFAPGEFTKLFQKVHETVDLIFSQGIDWQAFLISFNKLQIECDSDELSINSFENKGNGAFVIRVNAPDGADKAEIEKYLKKQYQLEAKVESQARELTNLYKVTELLAGRTITVTNQASSNTYNTETAGIVHNEGDISGNAKIAGVYNQAAQQNLPQAAASIQQLIDQLQQTNGVTLETAQQQAAKDLATKAQSDPILKDKLIQLGKFISENSAKTIVSEGVKGAIKLFLLMV